jgi:hypothetical protein
MDIWIGRSPETAQKMVRVLREFGFDVPNLSPDLFLREDQIVRMGLPPIRLEIFTAIPGVDFASCYSARVFTEIDGVPVHVISLEHLKVNKRASGRSKDLADLENLP